MKFNRNLLLLGLSLFIALLPTSAKAFDIPLLTWERGKEQNLVLGGNTSNEWKIELVDEADQSMLSFEASDISAEGFVVYSVFIPSDFPIGAYAVRATGLGIPASIVAGVNVVAMNFYEVIQIPWELLLVFLGYVFVTTALSAIRIRNHSIMRVREFDELDVDQVPQRLWTFYRLRERASNNLEPSLFQVLLRREGDLLRARSISAWALTPILAFVTGFAIGIQVLREGGIGNAAWILIFLGVVITALDLYSGLIAFVGFVMAQLIFGDVVALRDVMVLLAAGLAWSGAFAIGILFSYLHESPAGEGTGTQRYLGLFLGSVGAGVLFHAAQILVLSLVVVVSTPQSASWILSLLTGLIVLGKGMMMGRAADEGFAIREIVIGRVISPNSVAFLLLFFSGTLYIWMRDWIAALALAGVLALPYLLLVIRFAGPKVATLLRLKRIPLIEAVIVTLAAFLIFIYIQNLPFEVLERSRLFLALGVIPVLLHSLYSMFWDIADRSKGESASEAVRSSIAPDQRGES